MLFNDISPWYFFLWHYLINILDFNMLFLLYYPLPRYPLVIFRWFRSCHYLAHINPYLLLEPLVNLEQTNHPSGMFIPVLPLAQVNYLFLVCECHHLEGISH